MTTPIMLSVAGSDPSGGAGIQADLKTATALGVYGAAVLTSLTAQNTHGVTGIHPVPADFVADQLTAVLEDLAVGAIKIGMLATPEIAAAVADVLRTRPRPAIVLDPVMVATSGDRLVTPEVTEVIKEALLPLCTVITPNLPETAALLGNLAPHSPDEMEAAAVALRDLGCAALIKGGHLQPESPEPVDGKPSVRRPDQDAMSVDVLADDSGITHYSAPRIDTTNTHGTGCTLSSAIASGLARGADLRTAVGAAKDYLTGALRAGAQLGIGSGNGPVDHLWRNR
ncbi:bifunctional hydroxymethylpyrimidine kinase/phosphomethylpyrimidine kinase [Microlunatus soli]|uniref:Hydroxymethylpyrimidine kinase /phosphomethylpyrimidine kinase n=1 Tax=Microlunatus soli TaxID=630515 RepID=A0A1H1NNF7_9ACTN|nr:bifunctional hydroxymethylpyrimidine kinase/phosphomethylpyrimidine kinase [Microlunatus soli]SDS00536.1 hydroxymethylpyrimidine kinase /phosphomethylpyrimidine kinase [Microlunatus soli]